MTVLRVAHRLAFIVSLAATAAGIARGQPAAIETLPLAVEGQSYRIELPASGGVSPYHWSIEADAGVLPPGIELGPDGKLVGIPQRRGEYHFTIHLTDNLGQTVRQAVLLAVAPPQVELRPLILRTDSLPDAVSGREYSVALAGEGGAGPYRWKSPGPLPPGVSFAAETGILSGTPTRAGTYNVEVTVTDARGNSAPTRNLRLRVLEPTVARETSERRLSEWWKYIGLAVVLTGYVVTKQGINDRHYFRRRTALLKSGLKIEQTGEGNYLSGPQSVREEFMQLGRADRKRVIALRCLFTAAGGAFFIYVIFG